MKLIILEGARGAGKSTVAQQLRSMRSSTTLINPTGFKEDGEEGLAKIKSYYDNLFAYLESMKDIDCEIILDRFFYSEMVFSTLYKNYDFSLLYTGYEDRLRELVKNGVKVSIVRMYVCDEQVLSQRLNRNKIPFAEVPENVAESIKQDKLYTSLIRHISSRTGMNRYSIETDKLSLEESFEKVNSIVDRM